MVDSLRDAPGMEEVTIAADGRLMLDTAALPPSHVPRSGAPRPVVNKVGPHVEEQVTPPVWAAPEPVPWPTTPTPVPTHNPRYFVWKDSNGQRWLAHRYGEPVFVNGELHPETTKESVGEPAGWRDAAAVLSKDCNCVTHRGPCWLSYDLDWRESNADLVWPPNDYPPFLAGFAQEEAARLRELGRAMERNGVTSLLVLLRMAP